MHFQHILSFKCTNTPREVLQHAFCTWSTWGQGRSVTSLKVTALVRGQSWKSNSKPPTSWLCAPNCPAWLAIQSPSQRGYDGKWFKVERFLDGDMRRLASGSCSAIKQQLNFYFKHSKKILGLGLWCQETWNSGKDRQIFKLIFIIFYLVFCFILV